MKYNTLKWLRTLLIGILILPIIYVLLSLILIAITVNSHQPSGEKNKTIYLNSNGVHLDVIIPRKELPKELTQGMRYRPTDYFFAFGWGEENFYLNTPKWRDIRFSTAFRALFLKNSTLVHLARYNRTRPDWIEVNVTEEQLESLISYITATFQLDEDGEVIILPGKGYKTHDDFYKAYGSYSFLFTCNSWVNKGFKSSGLKACLWTPFDFGLKWKYGE